MCPIILVKCCRISVHSSSKLVDCQDLLGAISEVVDVKPRELNCRAKLLSGVNLATSDHKAAVITGQGNITELLTGNRNISTYAYHDINPYEENGITIKFDVPFFINHIHMMLWDGDKRFYQYYIEVSTDQRNWKKVIDYRQYACRSVQNLYFEKEIAQYVRVVGTHNSANSEFHLVYFEVHFKDHMPRIVNTIVCPTSNVATIDKKAAVLEGENGASLLNGITSDYDSYTYDEFGEGGIVIQLAQPFMLSSMKLLLRDQDDTFYNYYIEISINESEWTTIADYRDEERKSWQILRFSERPVVFVRITGTEASSDTGNYLDLLHFECPASDVKQTYK